MTMARPTMMDGIATLAVVKAKERKMEVVEMKMFRWSLRIRRKDGIRNEGIRRIVKVGDIFLRVRGQEECWWEVCKFKGLQIQRLDTKHTVHTRAEIPRKN